MTLDNRVEADILSTCNALGCVIRGEYEKSNDCQNCLRDLLLYLKRDDENHSVLRQLGSLRLLQTDLLPILKRYPEDREILDRVLRLLVALTNPALLLFNESVPEDKLTCNVYLQLISYLQVYKRNFTDAGVWKVLCGFLKDTLQKSTVERTEEESMNIERILIIMRNILHIPPEEDELKRTDDDISVHDQILWGLHLSEMDLLLLFLTSNDDEQNYCLHVLEIISLMLREQKPEVLLKTGDQRTNSEKEKDEKILLHERKKEHELKLRKMQTSCKPRFNGVYHVKNMKSISERDYIAHKLITNFDSVKFDTDKNKKRKPKNRLPVVDLDITRRSTLCIRLFLKKFCLEFLNCYNDFMALVRRSLTHKRSQDHDDSYYLWTMRFFMELNRYADFKAEYVSETITIQMFHYIQTQIDTYKEMLMTDKKKVKYWSKRMHLGLSAYRELLETLNVMEKSPEEDVKRVANVIANNVFYVIEYREMLLSLLLNYDQIKFSLMYLAELVEATHLFLKMLENYSKKHKVIVQKKKRKQGRKKRSQSLHSGSVRVENTEEKLTAEWDLISSDLSAVLQGRKPIPEDIVPFDATSELSLEDQKVEAVYKIRETLEANEGGKAVAVLRAARDLWPEGDSFGATDIEEEDEFMVLREIYFSNLQKDTTEVNSHIEEELDEDDEEEEAIACVVEQQLDLTDVYKRYASQKAVQPCCLLLENYQKNSPRTNLSLIKLLYRIAWNCKMHALFFQATLFLTFQKVFKDPEIYSDPVVKEIYKFSKFIVRKFFEVPEKNNKVFLELLFWKGPAEAYELEEGYGAHKDSASSKFVWTEDEEEELKYLYEENKSVQIDGQDVIDIILANIDKKSRTRKQVLVKLIKLGIVKNAKEFKQQKNEWQEAEIIELQELFSKYRDSKTVMADILENLTIKRSKHETVNKLLELNIIQDRKEVRKGRSAAKVKERIGNFDDDQFLDDRQTSDSQNQSDNSFDSELEAGDATHFGQIMNAQGNDLALTVKDTYIEWNEEEIMKIHQLYESNKDCQDIVKSISDSLGSRSRKEIKKKLKELNLMSRVISSKTVSKQFTEVKKKDEAKLQRKRAPKEWKEQEVIELHNLFQQYQTADDIITSIVEVLTVKRPKPKVIEKLLELGLIKDKKDVRKKRKAKNPTNKKTQINKQNTSFYESDEDFEDLPFADTDHVNKKSKGRKINKISSDDEDDDAPLSNFASSSQQNIFFLQSSEENALVNSDAHNKSEGEDTEEISIQTKKRKIIVLEESDDESQDRANNKNLTVYDNLQNNTISQSEKNISQNNLKNDEVLSSTINSMNGHTRRKKLLELGLIEDKKDVRKKGKAKDPTNKKTKINKRNTSFYESDEDFQDLPFADSDHVNQKSKGRKRNKISSDEDDDTPLSNFAPVSQQNILFSQISEKNALVNSIAHNCKSEGEDNAEISIQQKKRKRIVLEESDDENQDFSQDRANNKNLTVYDNLQNNTISESEKNISQNNLKNEEVLSSTVSMNGHKKRKKLADLESYDENSSSVETQPAVFKLVSNRSSQKTTLLKNDKESLCQNQKFKKLQILDDSDSESE